MGTVRWSAPGIIHYQFLNPDEAITAKYCQRIDRMYQELTRLHPTLVNRNSFARERSSARCTIDAAKMELSIILTRPLTNRLPLF